MTSSLLLELENLLEKPIASVIDYESSLFDQLLEKSQGQIVLFGAGNLGKKCLSGLRSVGIEPVAFVDNNSAIWNTKIERIDVLSPENAALKYGQNALFLVTIWSPGRNRSFIILKNQLHQLGCLNIAFFITLFWKYPTLFLPYYCIDLPHKIYEQVDDVIAVFYFLKDNYSKKQYLNQLKWRILLDFNSLSSSKEIQYLPQILLPLLSHEVFIDCGAFDGDTVKTLINIQKDSFEKIICFEPDPTNIKKLKDYISNLDLDNEIQEKVIIYQNATGEKREKLRFSATGSGASAISSEGELEVDSIPLDEILADEAPTFIKMDIEGAEIDTLLGAITIIKKYRPILAISVYHQQDHLWRIPLLVNSICRDYSYFLELHGEDGLDLVFYAIPNSRFAA
jgi:FkbM family methyltransferase